MGTAAPPRDGVLTFCPSVPFLPARPGAPWRREGRDPVSSLVLPSEQWEGGHPALACCSAYLPPISSKLALCRRKRPRSEVSTDRPQAGTCTCSPTPSPMALARTLAPLTAPASLPHLRPAARAGERLALLQAALHVAPLRTDVIALGTSGRVWSPWPHASASRTGQATLLPQGHPLHDQVGGEITFSCLPSHRGTSALSPRGGAFF